MEREELEELRERGDYWYDGADDFLAEHDRDQFHILEIIEEHHTDLMAFHEDFRELVVDELEEEFEEYAEMQQQMVEFARKALDTDQ